MKTSIFKKIVSLLAVTAIVMTSATVVFAANDYATQSTTCDAKDDNWSIYANADQGVSATITGGALKVERTKFRVSDSSKSSYQGLENATATGGYVYFVAGENGDWVAETEKTANPEWKYSFADGKSFSKGGVQVKGDLMFTGGAKQVASIEFTGTSNVSWQRMGVSFGKNEMKPLYPSGINGGAKAYDTQIVNNVWYTFTITYDIDGQKLDYTIEKKDDASWKYSDSKNIENSWGDYTKGKVEGVTFITYQNRDYPDATSTEYKSSVWYVDNLTIEGFSEMNYTAENVYRNKIGFTTNKYRENAGNQAFSLQGLKINRLTGVKDPSNVSLMTASYDSQGRMLDVKGKSISEVGTTPVDLGVTGTTVKSFVLNTKNAKPYMPVYEYTTPTNVYRLLDFSKPVTVNSYYSGDSNLVSDDRFGLAGYGADGGVTLSTISEDGNNVLKYERTIFGNSSRKYWTYDATQGKAVETESKTHYNFVGVPIGDTVDKITTSFRFKFGGVDHPDGSQEFRVELGKSKDVFLRIIRNVNGVGRLYVKSSGAAANGKAIAWGNGEDTRRMRADEWYDMTFTYDYSTGAFSATLKGVFDQVAGGSLYEELNGTTKLTGISNTNVNMLMFGLRHDIAAFPITEIDAETPTEFTKKTSVLYLDDIKIEYDTADIVQ